MATANPAEFHERRKGEQENLSFVKLDSDSIYSIIPFQDNVLGFFFAYSRYAAQGFSCGPDKRGITEVRGPDNSLLP